MEQTKRPKKRRDTDLHSRFLLLRLQKMGKSRGALQTSHLGRYAS